MNPYFSAHAWRPGSATRTRTDRSCSIRRNEEEEKKSDGKVASVILRQDLVDEGGQDKTKVSDLEWQVK